MSSLLSKVKSGVQLGPQIYLIYGPEKKGKSSFAAQFPQPIFLDVEGGTGQLNVQRLGPSDLPTYKTLISTVDDLIAEKAKTFKTVVIDSITAFEKLMAAQICAEGNKKSLDDFAWGGGTTRIDETTAKFNDKARELKAAGYDVVEIGHTKVKQFNDPMASQNYDRFLINCSDAMARQLKSAADNIFFINSPVTTFEEKGRIKASAEGKAVIYTQWHAAFDAGNRLNLPSPMDLSYSAIKKAITEYKPLPEKLKEEIFAMCERGEASKVEAARKATLEAGNDVVQLERIKAKLSTLVAV